MRATMLKMTHHHGSYRRPSFGVTEVLLIAGILAFGAFALVSQGGDGIGSLFAGVEDLPRLTISTPSA